MAELSDVFDLYFPSPPLLKELACIRVALDVWIGEMNKHSMTCPSFYPDIDSILPLKTLIPNAPSSILSCIEEYAKILARSISSWLSHNSQKKIVSHAVVRKFTDFVCDFDGTIDCNKTAKQMLRCDAFNAEVKFRIACEYGLVDDIARIWPQVKSNIFENDVSPSQNIELLYWVWRFRGQLYKLRGLDLHRGGPQATDSFIYDLYLNSNRLYGVNHFDQRFSTRTIDSSSFKVDCRFRTIFCRYMLVKLNEQQLQQLINYNVTELVLSCSQYNNSWSTIPPASLPIWNYIKHFMSESVFIQLIRRIVDISTSNPNEGMRPSVVVQSSYEEIWKTAPSHLKNAAIPDVLLSNFTYKNFTYKNRNRSQTITYDNPSFLFTLLEDFPIHSRRVFWNKQWRTLIGCLKLTDIESLMSMCFADENEIKQFKNNEMNLYENISPYCSWLLKMGHVEELLKHLRFCCPDEEDVRSVSRRLLQSDSEWYSHCSNRPRTFNEFIDFACGSQDANLAEMIRSNIFKPRNKAISSLLSHVATAHFQEVMQFVDNFVTSRKKVTNLKKREIVPKLKQLICNDDSSPFCCTEDTYFRYVGEGFSEFMNWCLENNDEIARFKQSLNLDGIIRSRIRYELYMPKANQSSSYSTYGSQNKCRCEFRLRRQREKDNSNSTKKPTTKPTTTRRSFLPSFIEWYCATAEDAEAVKRRYAGDYTFAKLMSI